MELKLSEDFVYNPNELNEKDRKFIDEVGNMPLGLGVMETFEPCVGLKSMKHLLEFCKLWYYNIEDFAMEAAEKRGIKFYYMDELFSHFKDIKYVIEAAVNGNNFDGGNFDPFLGYFKINKNGSITSYSTEEVKETLEKIYLQEDFPWEDYDYGFPRYFINMCNERDLLNDEQKELFKDILDKKWLK